MIWVLEVFNPKTRRWVVDTYASPCARKPTFLVKPHMRADGNRYRWQPYERVKK